jgi:hypothetical protein
MVVLTRPLGPWGVAKGSMALQTCPNRPGEMSPSPAPPDVDGSGLPPWMRWGGAALTALLAVLFLVLLQQVRQQGERLQALQDRVQTLENARDLERTNALEEQLRATVRRLQGLEGLRGSLQRLRSEQDNLRQQIRASDEAAGDELQDDPLAAPVRPQP